MCLRWHDLKKKKNNSTHMAVADDQKRKITTNQA